MKEDVVTVGLLSLCERNTDSWLATCNWNIQLAIMNVQLVNRDIQLANRDVQLVDCDIS